MKISNKPVPQNAIASLQNNAFARAPLIASALMSALGTWASIEAKVEGIYAHLSAASGSEMDAFRELRGWDRRADAVIKKVAETRPELQDEVSSLLAVAKDAADLRNEIAHHVWAVDANGGDHLFIYPAELFGLVSFHVARLDATETTEVFVKGLHQAGRLVGLKEADAARVAIETAEGLLHNGWLALFPAGQDLTGHSFADQAATIRQNADVAARMLNRARSRAKQEREIERGARIAERDGAGPSEPEDKGNGQA